MLKIYTQNKKITNFFLQDSKYGGLEGEALKNFLRKI